MSTCVCGGGHFCWLGRQYFAGKKDYVISSLFRITLVKIILLIFLATVVKVDISAENHSLQLKNFSFSFIFRTLGLRKAGQCLVVLSVFRPSPDPVLNPVAP